jgi:acetyl-CoA synthetase
MGWPLPGYRMTVIDTGTGRPVRDGTVGELCVDLGDPPVGLMSGYAGDDERTAAAFADGLYHTGDLVVAAADGCLRYVGRSDDMFKSFDHRISPLELEEALRAQDAVADVAVAPAPHPVGGWVPKAFVEPAAGNPADRHTADAIFAGVDRTLPPEKRVQVITFVPALPRTSSGKVRRGELRSGAFAGHPEFGAPARTHTAPAAG